MHDLPTQKPAVHVALVDQPIDVPSLQAKVENDDSGAIGWFFGVTRRTTGDVRTKTLHYEAHRPMAIDQMKQLASQAIETFGLHHVVLVHRLGEVPIGHASVVVGCSSPHRPATFDALPWIMDQLKRDVAIWKRETFDDDSQTWVHPTA